MLVAQQDLGADWVLWIVDCHRQIESVPARSD